MAAVTQPLARPRPRTRSRVRKARARGGILWIAIGGILLTGVVFVNVVVLQLNLRLDSANAERSKLLADNAADVVYRINVGPSPSFDYVNPFASERAAFAQDDNS